MTPDPTIKDFPDNPSDGSLFRGKPLSEGSEGSEWEEDELSSLQEVINAIRQSAGHDYITFHRAIHAKHSTFCAPLSLIGAAVIGEGLFVVDSSNQWHQVEDRPEDTRIIIRLLKYFHRY